MQYDPYSVTVMAVFLLEENIRLWLPPKQNPGPDHSLSAVSLAPHFTTSCHYWCSQGSSFTITRLHSSGPAALLSR